MARSYTFVGRRGCAHVDRKSDEGGEYWLLRVDGQQPRRVPTSEMDDLAAQKTALRAAHGEG